MNNLPEPPAGYYDRFKTKPVTIKPFDPASRDVAQRYIAMLTQLLPDVEMSRRGSSAWGIAGKGDIEVGVYPAQGNSRAFWRRSPGATNGSVAVTVAIPGPAIDEL